MADLPIISGSIIGTEELRARLARLDPERNTRILRNSLMEAAGRVRRNASAYQIIPMGGGKKNPAPVHPTRLTSRRGGAGLVGSIRVDTGPLPKAVEIGTELLYGALHEFGLGRMPRRAFLQPALDEEAPGFPEIVIKWWRMEGGV